MQHQGAGKTADARSNHHDIWFACLVHGHNPCQRQATRALDPAFCTSDRRDMEPSLALAHLTTLRVTVGRPIDIGIGAKGERRMIPITGGSVEGPGLNGRVLPGGADVQLIRADGVAEIDATYAIETDAGERVLVHNVGMRHGPPEVIAAMRRGEDVDASLVYFRTVPVFDTAAPTLASLTRDIFVGTGRRRPDHVELHFFRVL